jgi:hypothetical protein
MPNQFMQNPRKPASELSHTLKCNYADFIHFIQIELHELCEQVPKQAAWLLPV